MIKDEVTYRKKRAGYWQIIEIDNHIEELDIPDEIDGIPVKEIELKVRNKESMLLRKIKFPKHFVTTNRMLDFTAIHEADFSECEGLEYIAESAFEGCRSLKTVKLPASVIHIHGNAFYNCSQLADINLENVKRFEQLSFYGTKHLKELKTDAVIADKAFAKSGLQKIHISSKVIGQSAFSNCQQLTELTLAEDVELIDNYAFFDCSSLTEVSFPKTLSLISHHAFVACTELKKVDLSNTGMRELEPNVFYNCLAIKEVVLPDSLESIGYGCFYNTALEEVDLKNVKAVYGGAFQNCTALSFVISRNPDIRISDTAFQETNLLP